MLLSLVQTLVPISYGAPFPEYGCFLMGSICVLSSCLLPVLQFIRVICVPVQCICNRYANKFI